MQADDRFPGLAYRLVSADDDRYELVHLTSGFGLGGTVETQWIAERWLALVAPLADWTQDAPVLQSDPTLAEKIQKLRRQAEAEASVQLRSLLPDIAVEKLSQRAYRLHCSLYDLIVEAIEAFLKDEEDDEDESENKPDYIKEVLRTYAARDTWEDKLTLGALGLAGEAGEVVDIVKKWRYQGHAIDALHFREEMGDILWYLALMCSAFGWTLDDVIAANIRKMHERYPDGFESSRSLHRKEEGW